MKFNVQKSLALYYLKKKSYERLKLSDYVSVRLQQKISNFKVLVGSYNYVSQFTVEIYCFADVGVYSSNHGVLYTGAICMRRGF